MSMPSDNIQVLHSGPVESFRIDLSRGPGLYELRGTKGSGKSTVLASIDLLAGRKVTITVTDGELSGEVSGFGVVAPIGGRRRRRGELEVSTLDPDSFSIEDLIRPPYKDQIAADRHRIKALIHLRGVIAEPADYYDLVGSKLTLETLVPADKLSTDDPVLLSRLVKESLEAKARSCEGFRDHEMGHAKSLRESAEKVDLSAPSDAKQLREAYDTMKERQLKMLQQRTAAMQHDKEIREAKKALELAQSEYSGPSSKQASSEHDDASKALADQRRVVSELEQQLRDASAESDRRAAAEELTSSKLLSAKHHEKMLSVYMETLDRPAPESPSDLEILAVGADLEAASEAIENGSRVRDAAKSVKDAESHSRSAESFSDKAAAFREQSRATFDILTRLVDSPAVKVESIDGEPRLVVQHPKRGKTLFSELSDGEQVLTAIESVLPQIECPGLFPLPQRVYQDLPPADRKQLSEYSTKHGIYMFGAQVTDGDLSVARYGNGDA